MFFTEARLNKRKYRGKVIVFVVFGCITMLTGCSQANIEAPYRGWNIWGFANKEEKRSNTFTATTPIVMDTTQYSYYDEPTFQQMVKAKFRSQYKSIYRAAYQEEVYQEIKSLIKKNSYSTEHPLLIQNPYGTNASGLYVYMGNSKEDIRLFYTVASENEAIPDFSETMYINKTVSEAVEGQIVGLIPGQYNKLVLELRDATGNQISERAYLLYVPENETTIAPNVDVLQSVANQDSRGLFHLLVHNEQERAFYLFYDNNGILRSQIPSRVSDLTGKILQIDNRLFYECSDNVFVLVDNLGRVEKFYQYKKGFNLVDYDYDEINHKILFLAKNPESKDVDVIVQLDLKSKEWETKLKFSELVVDTKRFLLCNIQIINGKDVIVCSRTLSSVFRINNIYAKPVIRWIIGDELQWKDSKYESMLLYEIGDLTSKYSLDSVKYVASKGLDRGQLVLSLIDYNNPTIKNKTPIHNTQFRKYLLDEYQNQYWSMQLLDIPPHSKNCSALVYGNHVIFGLGDEQEIIEYNEKGEILLRMRFPNKNSSYNINKDTMDRYWF